MITDEKRELRRRVRAGRAARRDTPDAAGLRDRDAEAVAVAGLDLARRHGADVVALFDALPAEPPTDALAAALVADGRTVLLPRMLPDRDLTWHAYAPDARDRDDGDTALPLGPDLGREGIGRAGLVVVPALATDAAGRRLGQGGGSYDRALTRLAPDALVVALVHDDEVLPRIPVEAHDAPTHGRLTPSAGWTAATDPAPTGDDGGDPAA